MLSRCWQPKRSWWWRACATAPTEARSHRGWRWVTACGFVLTGALILVFPTLIQTSTKRGSASCLRTSRDRRAAGCGHFPEPVDERPAKRLRPDSRVRRARLAGVCAFRGSGRGGMGCQIPVDALRQQNTATPQARNVWPALRLGWLSTCKGNFACFTRVAQAACTGFLRGCGYNNLLYAASILGVFRFFCPPSVS